MKELNDEINEVAAFSGTNSNVCPKCEREAAASLMTFEEITKIALELDNSDEKIASKEDQNKRLKACSSCDALRGGVLCSWCGCYVLLRARVLNGYCPYPKKDKWKI